MVSVTGNKCFWTTSDISSKEKRLSRVFKSVCSERRSTFTTMLLKWNQESHIPKSLSLAKTLWPLTGLKSQFWARWGEGTRNRKVPFFVDQTPFIFPWSMLTSRLGSKCWCQIYQASTTYWPTSTKLSLLRASFSPFSSPLTCLCTSIQLWLRLSQIVSS